MKQFDAWLRTAVTGAAAERDEELDHWVSASFARLGRPREEQMIPLMVVAGVARADTGVVTWSGRGFNSTQTGFHFG